MRVLLTGISVRRATLLASFKALGAIRALILTAGLAAITAVAASWLMRLVTGGSRLGWASPLQVFALEIAGTFLIAALGTSALMPRAHDASRIETSDRGPSSIVMLLLAALAITAVLQLTSLRVWWAEDRVLLAQATGGDPSSLRLIPGTVLFSLPILGALAILTFVLTSIIGILARAQVTFSLLAACVFLQAGVVIGEQFLLHAMDALGATVRDAIAQSPDAKAAAQVSDWLARHDAAAARLSWRLVWILGGYAVAAAVSGLVTNRSASPAAAVSTVPLVDPPLSPSVGLEPAAAAAPADEQVPVVFPHVSYSVRPRQKFVDFFRRRYSTYDVNSIPPSMQSRFSFSWQTRRLRREPNGPDLVVVARGDRRGVLTRRDHVVKDARSGAIVGALRAAGGDWEVVDRGGTPYGRIAEEKSGAGYIVYVATVHGQPACRFTWAMQGLTVASSGVDVEFLSTADGSFDRRFALAIAPVVEHKARRARGRRT